MVTSLSIFRKFLILRELMLALVCAGMALTRPAIVQPRVRMMNGLDSVQFPAPRAIDAIHQEADAYFDAIDVDGSGAIDEEELRAHLTSSAGYPSAAVDSMFGLLDANSDGEISREELRTSFGRYQFSALRLALGRA